MILLNVTKLVPPLVEFYLKEHFKYLVNTFKSFFQESLHLVNYSFVVVVVVCRFNNFMTAVQDTELHLK